MVFTNEEVAMIEGIIGSFFSGGHVSEDVRHAYSRVWQHLAADTLDTEVWGDRIFEKCGIRREEEGDGGKTLEIRGKRRLSARDGGANYQQS